MEVAAQRSLEFWQQCQADCIRILKELLGSEFKDVKEKVVIVLDFVERGVHGDVQRNWRIKGFALIRIYTFNWDLQPNFSDSYLIQLIRHELLHLILPGIADQDPNFLAEEKRRGIETGGVIYGEWFDLLKRDIIDPPPVEKKFN